MFRWLSISAVILAEEPPQLDARALYVLGGLLTLAGIFFFVVKGINETRTLMRGHTAPEQVTVSAPVPNPITVVSPPVFATVEVVDRVDKQLNAKFDKLDDYVHESIHKQAKEIQGVAMLVKAADEEQRAGIADVNKQGESRISGVHTRLNEMDRTIGTLSAHTQTANHTMTEVRRTLETLLSRTAPNPPRRGGGAIE